MDSSASSLELASGPNDEPRQAASQTSSVESPVEAIAGRSRLESLPLEISERIWELACLSEDADEHDDDCKDVPPSSPCQRHRRAATYCLVSKAILPVAQSALLYYVFFELGGPHQTSLCDYLVKYRHRLHSVRKLRLFMDTLRDDNECFTREQCNALFMSISCMRNVQELRVYVEVFESKTSDGDVARCLSLLQQMVRSMPQLRSVRWEVDGHERQTGVDYTDLSDFLAALHPAVKLQSFTFGRQHSHDLVSSLSRRYHCLATVQDLSLEAVCFEQSVLRCECLVDLALWYVNGLIHVWTHTPALEVLSLFCCEELERQAVELLPSGLRSLVCTGTDVHFVPLADRLADLDQLRMLVIEERPSPLATEGEADALNRIRDIVRVRPEFRLCIDRRTGDLGVEADQ